MSGTNQMPKSGRITLTLDTKTIKDLRLLAALRDTEQSTVAEEFLLRGGLQLAVEAELQHEKGRGASSGQDMPIRAAAEAPAAIDPVIPKPKLREMPVIHTPPVSMEPAASSFDSDIPW